jgi:hypothetical protein
MHGLRQLARWVGKKLIDLSCPPKILASGVSPELEDAFWTRVEKTNSCWLWLGPTNHDGIPVLCRREASKVKVYTAARLSWIIAHGEIESFLRVYHSSCDEKLCVNPAHFTTGTFKEQGIHNKTKHKRNARGTQCPWAKLTESQVIEIRSLYAKGNITQANIARKFMVGETAIYGILSGKTWRHIPKEGSS